MATTSFMHLSNYLRHIISQCNYLQLEFFRVFDIETKFFGLLDFDIISSGLNYFMITLDFIAAYYLRNAKRLYFLQFRGFLLIFYISHHLYRTLVNIFHNVFDYLMTI